MWQSSARPPILTHSHAHTYTRTHTHACTWTHTFPAHSSTWQIALSPLDLQCLGQAGSLSLNSLLCVTAWVGASLCITLHSWSCCRQHQPDVAEPTTGGVMVCELFLTWSIWGCLKHQSGPPFPTPSDVQKGPEMSGLWDQAWPQDGPGGSRPYRRLQVGP